MESDRREYHEPGGHTTFGRRKHDKSGRVWQGHTAFEGDLRSAGSQGNKSRPEYGSTKDEPESGKKRQVGLGIRTRQMTKMRRTARAHNEHTRFFNSGALG